MNDLAHIHPEFRHVAGSSPEERIRFMEQPRWLGYPRANRLIERLRHLMEVPKRPRMPNLLIVGEPNNGKTTIVRRFQELHGEGYVDDESDPVKPVIVTEAPASADMKGLYISILEHFWAPYRPGDPVNKLHYQATHLLRHCNVKVLVIDEFHSLLTGSPRKQREVMNALKHLCNETMIPIVGVGTREAVRVLHTDPQHASRFDVATLPLWDLDKEFQKLLMRFEAVLPLRRPSRLHEPELATLLHAISGGNLGDLHRLLAECAEDAIRTGNERIDKPIIESKSWLRPSRGVREIEY